jgi:hypothetical protein
VRALPPPLLAPEFPPSLGQLAAGGIGRLCEIAPSIIMVAAQSKRMNGRRKLNPPFLPTDTEQSFCADSVHGAIALSGVAVLVN